MRRLWRSDVWSPRVCRATAPYYSCQKRLGRHESCGGIHIQVPAADHAVTAQILAYLASPNGPTVKLDFVTPRPTSRPPRWKSRAQTKLSELNAAYDADQISTADWIERKRKFEPRLKAATTALEAGANPVRRDSGPRAFRGRHSGELIG